MIYKSDGSIIVIVKGDNECQKNELKKITEAAQESTAADLKDQQTR
jgi:acylphosphatase